MERTLHGPDCRIQKKEAGCHSVGSLSTGS